MFAGKAFPMPWKGRIKFLQLLEPGPSLPTSLTLGADIEIPRVDLPGLMQQGTQPGVTEWALFRVDAEAILEAVA
jgi:hypothetical protein